MNILLDLSKFLDLNVDLPLNHLIPRVPQRINYVLWIEDLIQRNQEAKGIDVGKIIIDL